MAPYRLSLKGEGYVASEEVMRNVEANAGVPMLSGRAPHSEKLAIVGGGNSARHNLDELLFWDGAIWAINGACQWLTQNGVESAFFTADPYPGKWVDTVDTDKIGSAILSTSCNPELFTKLGAKVIGAFHSEEQKPGGLFAGGGTTSVGRARPIALQMGYHDITFFGCEGSWKSDGRSHAYKDEVIDALIVRAGGVDYVTNLQFMVQSQELAAVIMKFPNVFKECSGGLLRAMIEHADTWEIAAFSKELSDRLDNNEGRVPYRVAA